MKKIALIGLLITTVLLSSCASKSIVPTVASRSDKAAPEMSIEMLPAGATYSAEMEAPADARDNQAAGAVEQIVIKNAGMSIVVVDADDTVLKISALAAKYGGFVVNSNVWKSTGGNKIEYTQGEIIIRVQADKLDFAMAEIRAMTSEPENDVTSEYVSGEDVTATVVDLESQLRSYQAAATKLNQFLDSAKTTEDALKVFNQLTAIEKQIEILQGQIKYYRESARLSAISVSISEKTTIAPVTTEGWKPLKILRDAAQALVKALQFIANILIYFVIFCGPFILVLLVLPFWITWMSLKKKGWTRRGLRLIRPMPTPPPLNDNEK